MPSDEGDRRNPDLHAVRALVAIGSLMADELRNPLRTLNHQSELARAWENTLEEARPVLRQLEKKR